MIRKSEFIGKQAEIDYCGLTHKGEIVDETKNLFYLKTSKGVIKIVKMNAVLHMDGEKIQGSDLAKRPEERIKSC